MRRILRESQRVYGVTTTAATPARTVRVRSSFVAAHHAPVTGVVQFHGGRANSSPFDRDQVSNVWNAATVAASVAAVMALTLGRDEHSTARCLSTLHAEQRDRYSLSKELGRGGFSVVRLALDTKTNERLAAKIFDPNFCSMDDIKAEIAILKYLGKHRNIVGLHDVQSRQNETIMFTDLVEGGELFDYIVDMGSISERDASRLLHDVCTGLEYIHSLGVCHRDLKPENVLLTDHSSSADLKLADFGLSRRLRPDENVVEPQPSGTVIAGFFVASAYWAPEIIRRQPQGLAVDMWAFGVLAYITLTGVHPFDPRGDKSDAEIVTQIARGKYDMSNKWYRALSSDAKAFLAELLDPNPSTRLSAKQALAHPWLRGQTPATTPLPDGHARRLLAYQRLQKLRANILTVIMGQQHAKFESKPHKPSSPAKARAVVVPATVDTATMATTTTLNMDMFREAFTLFDKDESGYITRDELANILNALGQQLHTSEVDAIMREADLDGDDKISFHEFVAMMNQRLFKRGEITEGDLRSAFNLFDSNGDGFINGEELQHIMHVLGNLTLTMAEASQIIAGVDANGDGKIDFHEFQQLMGTGGLNSYDQSEPRP